MSFLESLSPTPITEQPLASWAQFSEQRMEARIGHVRRAARTKTSITWPLRRQTPEPQPGPSVRFSERLLRVLHQPRRRLQRPQQQLARHQPELRQLLQPLLARRASVFTHKGIGHTIPT